MECPRCLFIGPVACPGCGSHEGLLQPAEVQTVRENDLPKHLELHESGVPQQSAKAPMSPELQDALTLLKTIAAPCDVVLDHKWRDCKRCMAVHGIERRFKVSMRLIQRLLSALASPEVGASESQGEGDCLAPLVPLPDAPSSHHKYRVQLQAQAEALTAMTEDARVLRKSLAAAERQMRLLER
jgi:hypothetical protein